jgi:two-component system response regulator VicR
MNKKMSTILICEDDRLMAQIIEQVVKSDLVEIKVVGNGALAINELKKKTFDLVITDAVMPEKTGLDVISFIRRHQRSATPVLMMSGLSETNYIRLAKEKGVSDFLAKPFSAEKLRRKVQQLLHVDPFVSRLVV